MTKFVPIAQKLLLHFLRHKRLDSYIYSLTSQYLWSYFKDYWNLFYEKLLFVSAVSLQMFGLWARGQENRVQSSKERVHVTCYSYNWLMAFMYHLRVYKTLLHAFSHLLHSTVMWGWYYDYSYFTDRKLKPTIFKGFVQNQENETEIHI